MTIPIESPSFKSAAFNSTPSLIKPDSKYDDIVKMKSWNKMKIKVVDENVTTWINGKKMINLSDERIGDANGSIALQIHDGGGIKVRWKDIIIREIY